MEHQVRFRCFEIKAGPYQRQSCGDSHQSRSLKTKTFHESSTQPSTTYSKQEHMRRSQSRARCYFTWLANIQCIVVYTTVSVTNLRHVDPTKFHHIFNIFLPKSQLAYMQIQFIIVDTPCLSFFASNVEKNDVRRK